jgi:hypothetical protein
VSVVAKIISTGVLSLPIILSALIALISPMLTDAPNYDKGMFYRVVLTCTFVIVASIAGIVWVWVK